MGVNLLQGVPVVIWQTADAVLNVQLVLAHHGGSTLSEQFVVVKQTARYGILDGADANHRRVSLDILEHLLEGGAANQLNLFALKILMGSDVVKRPQLSLYCYSLHCRISLFYLPVYEIYQF